MDFRIQKALNALHSKLAARAPQAEIIAARKGVTDAMETCHKEDVDGDTDLAEAGKKIAEADAMVKLAGYNAGRDAPTATNGSETGSPADPGFAPDVKPQGGEPAVKLVEPTARLMSNNADAAPHRSPAYVTVEAKPWMAHTDHILAEIDEYRKMSANFDPDSSAVKSLRKANRPFVDKMIEQCAQRHYKARSAQEWFQAGDALLNNNEKALCDAIDQAVAATDSVTTSNLFNQPSISAALLVQQFQDLEALQFCHGIGPGIDNGNNNGGFQMFPTGDGAVGSVLRVPTEYYTPPGGYGATGGTFDAGLSTPENTGIDEAQINIAWQSFAPTPRQIAISLTRNAIRAMGNGPLNYGAVGRALYHITGDKSRRIDKGLYDEMLQCSDEYLAKSVTAETVNLTNNSSFLGGGSVAVNLNPAKTAVAVIAATDPSVTYGANVIGAVRFASGSAGTASPFAGTSAGTTPICRPRTKIDLSSVGAVTSTVNNPIVLTAPAAGVEGYIDSTGQIQDKPGAAGSTYAIDYNNGVLVFKSGVAGTAGLITTTVTIGSYSYITNYDNFIVNNPTFATGETPSGYYNRLFQQIDVTSALMGSAPRYVSPNLLLSSMGASTYITSAQIFYNLNSPSQTNLFPTENYYFERTGVKGARHNATWNAKDTALLLLRKGSTKYAIDTPFEIKGPFPAYDSNQKIIAKDVYYGFENSVLATPQVTDQGGNTLNPVSRKILLR